MAGEASKPNILVIWGDDIGITNLSCYSDGLMGYRTPNIDRLAKEGMKFTDSYGEQSCTAGRAAFISGQSVYRTGMSKVGCARYRRRSGAGGSDDRRAAQAAGYATGQFGKNHLGDLNKHLPTNHGFDEFFGNLYHLNAEEEPELPDFPDKRALPGPARHPKPPGGHPLLGDRRGSRRDRPEVRAKSEAAHRGHRTAEPQAHGDHRRRDRRGVH